MICAPKQTHQLPGQTIATEPLLAQKMAIPHDTHKVLQLIKPKRKQQAKIFYNLKDIKTFGMVSRGPMVYGLRYPSTKPSLNTNPRHESTHATHEAVASQAEVAFP